MNPRRRAFVNAYLGDANGNGTKAAISAGYSEQTAAQSSSRLLKEPEVRDAIAARLDKAGISTDRILNRLGIIANTDVEQVEARDVINASKVILQVNGALQPKASTDNRIVVNIGFLHAGPMSADSPQELATAAIDALDITELSQDLRPQAQLSGGSGTPDIDE
jgi:hypothetical protein